MAKDHRALPFLLSWGRTFLGTLLPAFLTVATAGFKVDNGLRTGEAVPNVFCDMMG
jgi:hypothetical protein